MIRWYLCLDAQAGSSPEHELHNINSDSVVEYLKVKAHNVIQYCNKNCQLDVYIGLSGLVNLQLKNMQTMINCCCKVAT